ncbi:MAG: hypothetical protein LBM70_08035 [Victivallales bacterium]|nr:hypothetical protein [Victivallales bacterium]
MDNIDCHNFIHGFRYMLSVIAVAITICRVEALEIRGGKFGNWFILNEEVHFSSSCKIASEDRIEVEVFDSSNRSVWKETVPAGEFSKNGWKHRFDRSGYYEAEFRSALNGPIAEAFEVEIRKQDPKDKRRHIPVAKRSFPIIRHGFVVAPAKTRQATEIAPVFGASPHMHFYREALPLAALVGFHGIRVHNISWEGVNPAPGVYKWDFVDEFMRVARASGFSDESILFNIFVTPRWASPHPEEDWINVCIRQYATYAPKNMDDWTAVLRELVRRYPKVRGYELWNEPHIPGFSCFWNDSPENFVRLMKSGYEAIKKERPDAPVWIGGMGMRYLPFYRTYLKLGGGPWFDVLALHGVKTSAEPFREYDKAAGIKEKPWVNSEWHAMLMNPLQEEFPSDRLLSRNMLINFLDMVRDGAHEIDFFSIINLQHSERESLSFYREYNQPITHVSGLFRRSPYPQPRYPAAAWHNFVALIKGEIKVLDGYFFTDSSNQKAQLISSDAGLMLIFWNESGVAEKIHPELLRAFGTDSILQTADGAVLPRSAELKLEPETYYILRNPNQQSIARWTGKGDVLSRAEGKNALENKYQGVYRDGLLFDKAMNNLGSFDLLQLSQKRSCNPAIKVGEISACFAAGLGDDAFDLYAEVVDAVHHPETADMAVWEGDSLQFAFDTRGRGIAGDRVEFAAALGTDGKPHLWKVVAPNLEGDLPGRYTAAGNPVRNAVCKFERKQGSTVYRIRLSSSELLPLVPERGTPLRFSVLVNNNDGKGRAVYLEWSTGIGGIKDPSKFGTLSVSARTVPALTMKSLIARTPKNAKYRIAQQEGVIRVETGDEKFATLGTSPVPIVGGGNYLLRFEARGNLRLQAMLSGKTLSRIDILSPLQLEDAWQKMEIPVSLPRDAKDCAVTFFAWDQLKHYFEIRNFSFSPR